MKNFAQKWWSSITHHFRANTTVCEFESESEQRASEASKARRKPSTMARVRNAVFTLNNPEGLLDFDPDWMSFLVYQEEIGESGTYHFQGYCEFSQQIPFPQAKELLGGPGVHIEPRRGTQEQAIAYSEKEDTRVDGPYRHGIPRVQGKRVDLEHFKNEVFDGKRKRDLIHDHVEIIAKYPRFYDTLTMMNRPQRTTDLVVTLLYGQTGLGKTRSVMERFGASDDFYVAPLNNGTMWYDTYDGHKRVLLDDFSGAASHISLCSLLRLLDRYPVLVPTKGSHTWWLPDEVFVTTNILPKDWFKWENRGEQYKAMARRFHKVFVYSTTTVEPVEREDDWWQINAPFEAVYTAANPFNFPIDSQ